MPAPELNAPVEAIRREAERARDESSLRAVAREAGVSAMGLSNFLRRAGKPQARTIRKLTQWYARRMATRLPEGEDEARAALIILAGFFPESERQAAVLEHLELAERRFLANGMEVPAWVETLRREVQTGPDWLRPPPRG
jgi:transcriptional regulator with XRE-family HTH domain